MLNDLDGNDLFNTLMLERGHSTQACVVVEGETDFNLLADFLRNESLDIVVGYGKQSLLDASHSASVELPKIVFLVDADLDRLTGAIDGYSSNVVATDFYDLYMDAHAQDPEGLVRVARRFLEKATISTADGIDRAFEAAAAVGAARHVSKAATYDLNLHDFPVHLVMSASDGRTEISKVVDLALKRSKPVGTTAEALSAEISERMSAPDCVFIVNSHDLLSALHFCCTRFGTGRVSQTMDQLFELAIDRSVFEAMPVIKRLEDRLAS
ncbi:hypothetical protein [Frigoribacterium endophyticum]|uniref:hypothetical protein n=1 Tax=Frigoribacterium endophyticum TaxID=1522176 RepID=UPI00141EF0F8|nr:hypothetical protein [Frigoribacterium endophyticum]NII52149.1 hypothetical protein [Frigoribacterium endophyticum]